MSPIHQEISVDSKLSSYILLKPDKNRPKLRSRTSKMLERGIITDSLFSSKTGLQKRKSFCQPRVLLIVPYYTRIKRSLDLIEANLVKKQGKKLSEDLVFIDFLRKEGITHLEEMKRAGIPMGLLRVGTQAKRKGYEVQILDAVFEGWANERNLFTSTDGNEIIAYGLDEEAIAQKIRSFNPDIVGITCDYTHQWGNARAVADLVKCIDENIVVVMGGTHPTGLPQDILLDSTTDYVVMRQADITFTELLDFLTHKNKTINKNIEEINGIAYRKDGKLVLNSPRKFLRNMSEIFKQDYSLLDLALYSKSYHSGGKRMVEDGFLVYGFTTVGCNTGCSFCSIPCVQGRWLRMNEEQLNQYLAFLVRKGVTEFIVEDDNLFYDPLWVLQVCGLLGKYNLPWFEEGGVALYSLIALFPEITEEFIEKNIKRKELFGKVFEAKKQGITAERLIKRMAGSGCYSIYLAVESANSESLETSNKPQINSIKSYTQKVVRLFQENGIHTTVGLMLGFVNPIGQGKVYVEKREQIERTIKYGKKLKQKGASFINPFIFTPLPGAPHFKQVLEYSSRNTDEAYTHEFASMDFPGEWTKDELTLLRVRTLVESNGLQGYKRMLERGTWPVN